jgi:hypothetical protein
MRESTRIEARSIGHRAPSSNERSKRLFNSSRLRRIAKALESVDADEREMTSDPGAS